MHSVQGFQFFILWGQRETLGVELSQLRVNLESIIHIAPLTLAVGGDLPTRGTRTQEVVVVESALSQSARA